MNDTLYYQINVVKRTYMTDYLSLYTIDFILDNHKSRILKRIYNQIKSEIETLNSYPYDQGDLEETKGTCILVNTFSLLIPYFLIILIASHCSS